MARIETHEIIKNFIHVGIPENQAEVLVAKLSWTEQALEQYLCWQITNINIIQRINKLIKDIQRHPFEGIGKPEPLKHRSAWSRRIDEKHRLVYQVTDQQQIDIIQLI